MLENFQLAALSIAGRQKRLLQIPLHQHLQDALTESWQEQCNAFVANIDEINFDPGYHPEEHERFRIEGYKLPDWLQGESSQTIQHLAPINQNENLVDSIKSIAAFANNEQGEELILFQSFSRSHVIRPGQFLLLRNNTYQSEQRPGLTLGGKLSAMYLATKNKLLFQNFRAVNTFLPLADFYEDASEQEIRDILAHELFDAENPDSLAKDSNQWFRKRFAMLRDSGIRDEYTAQQITDHSIGYDIDIVLTDDKIVFPAEKAAAKRLLQFLNEELFRGAITDTLYETNSKREAD